MSLASLALQLNSIDLQTGQLKQALEMTSEALVDECVNKRIDAGVESNDDDSNDISDVTIFLFHVVVVEHIDDQHWEPRNGVHSTHLMLIVLNGDNNDK